MDGLLGFMREGLLSSSLSICVSAEKNASTDKPTSSFDFVSQHTEAQV